MRGEEEEGSWRQQPAMSHEDQQSKTGWKRRRLTWLKNLIVTLRPIHNPSCNQIIEGVSVRSLSSSKKSCMKMVSMACRKKVAIFGKSFNLWPNLSPYMDRLHHWIIVQFCSQHKSNWGRRGCPLAIWWYWSLSFGLGSTSAIEVCWQCCRSPWGGAGCALVWKICLDVSWTRPCHLPLSRIHGDIKQLHLSFRSRFRRSDLIGPINNFHRRRSRVAPNAIQCRPRETNVISAYLAG